MMLTIIAATYGIITFLVICVNLSEWANQDEYVTVEPKRWDDIKRTFIEPVKARNPARRHHARLAVFAPLWPATVLIVAGRLIGEVMIDAFRRED